MYELIFLICLALIWITFAVIQDVRKREIANWLNFSLIIFAIGFRFFYSLFSEDFSFFYQGAIGLGIFFALGNLFYYSRIFAGGDAKLLFALGAIIPFSNNFFINLEIFILFILVFFFSGAIYGMIVSSFLAARNFSKFKKEFSKQFKLRKTIFYISCSTAVIFLILSFINYFLIYFAVLVFILPYFYIGAKSIEEVCMIKKISPKNLSEGDWLYHDVRIGNKIIKKNWEGLNKEEIKMLKNKKFILIKHGIPFGPVFLISFLVLIFLWFKGMVNLLW